MNILMLVHTFPPRGSIGGSIRLIKFLKYLNELGSGIKCTILTVRDDIVLLNDPHLSSMSLSDIPAGVKIIKTNTMQPRHRSLKPEKSSEDISASSPVKSKRINSFLKRAYAVVERLFLIPDYAILWFPYSIKAAVKEIRSNNTDIIYATAPPFSVLVQSVIIKKITKKKLILDIKDDWIYQTNFTGRPSFLRNLEAGFEKFCVKNADKIILVTPRSYEDFVERYPLFKNKFSLITNGCDIAEYEEFWHIENKKNEKFTVIHSGVVSNSRNPEGFIKALSELRTENVITENNFRVIFIGTLHRNIHDAIIKYNLNDIISTSHLLERKDFIKELTKADLLLAFNYQVKTVIPGKLYDYWGSRKPVLLVDKPDSGAARFVIEHELGDVRDFEDVTGIKETIGKYFAMWKNNGCSNKLSTENLFKYDRKLLTKQLIEIFETV